MKIVNEDNPERAFTLDDLDLLILGDALDEYIERLNERRELVGYRVVLDQALGLREWLKENTP